MEYSDECKRHLSSLLGASVTQEEFITTMRLMAQTGLWKLRYGETTDGKDVVIAKISGKKGWTRNKTQQTKVAARKSGVRLVGLQERTSGQPSSITWTGSFDDALKPDHPLYNDCGEVAYDAHISGLKKPGDSQYFTDGYKHGKPCDPTQE